MFEVNFGWSRVQTVEKIVANNGVFTTCGQGSNQSPSSSIKENCSMFKRVPYYIDRTNGVSLFKETTEQLTFSESSTKTATFRQAMGNALFHKILIKDSVKATGTEKFVLENNGTRSTVCEVQYSYNPFPLLAPQQIYGLNGAVVTQGDQFGPPEPNVSMVIILPIPPSQGIPLDADIAAYGFYDYLGLAEGSGMSYSPLMINDGGLDFFYPEWCRNMMGGVEDTLWAETRTRRFELNFPGIGQPRPDVVPSATWNPPKPETYCWPFGSFSKDNLEHFLYSALLDFSAHSRGGTKIVHYASFGDLKKAIFTDNKLAIAGNWILTPVNPV
jgi:hypothetical protein